MEFDPSASIEPHKQLYANQIEAGLRTGKYMEWGLLAGHPHIMQYGTQASPVTVPTFPTAAQDNVAGIIIPGAFGNNYVEMYSTTAQTLMPSRHATKGLEIALDQVDNESVEYVLGGNHASNPLGYLAGTDPGVFLRVTFEIPDASGMDQFGIFWRKQEAYAVPVSFLTTGDPVYTDILLFGFAATAANPNPLKISYDLNNSGSATVLTPNFTVADDSLVTLEARLSGRYAEYYINGVPLGGRVAKNGIGTAITAQSTTSVPRVRVDAGDFFIPGIFCRQDTDNTPAYVRKVVCGQILAETPNAR